MHGQTLPHLFGAVSRIRPPPASLCPWAWLAWGGQVVLSPSVPCPSWHIPTGVPPPWARQAQRSSGVESGGTRMFWRGGAALWGGCQKPHQQLGIADPLPPQYPTLPFLSRLVAECSVDGKQRHGRWGGTTDRRTDRHYSGHVPAMPTSQCQLWLVPPPCPSPQRVPHPDSHPHGHSQLSTSFQTGAGVGAGRGEGVWGR